jgi:probable HAF family extracellular repeat protein
MNKQLIRKHTTVAILGTALTLAGAIGTTPASYMVANAAPNPARHVRITDLGTLGGASSKAFGINQRGDVVGQSETADGRTHAFLSRNGRMTDLGTLPFDDDSVAYGINRSGAVVGYSQHSRPRATLDENGTQSFVGLLPGARFSYAYAINSNGDVVGESGHAFLYQDGTMIDLGTLGGYGSAARGINDDGAIVGESITANGDTHAFLFEDGTMTDLGTLPGDDESVAYGINDSEAIVGYSLRTHPQAVLFDNGTVTTLGILPGGRFSYAYGINRKGEVVGESGTASGDGHAVLWSKHR